MPDEIPWYVQIKRGNESDVFPIPVNAGFIVAIIPEHGTNHVFSNMEPDELREYLKGDYEKPS